MLSVIKVAIELTTNGKKKFQFEKLQSDERADETFAFLSHSPPSSTPFISSCNNKLIFIMEAPLMHGRKLETFARQSNPQTTSFFAYFVPL